MAGKTPKSWREQKITFAPNQDFYLYSTNLGSKDCLYYHEDAPIQFHFRSSTRFFFSFGKLPLSPEQVKEMAPILWSKNYSILALFLQAEFFNHNDTDSFFYIPEIVVQKGNEEERDILQIYSISPLTELDLKKRSSALHTHFKDPSLRILKKKSSEFFFPQYSKWEECIHHSLKSIERGPLKKVVLHRRKSYLLEKSLLSTEIQNKLFQSPLQEDHQFYFSQGKHKHFFGQTPEYLFVIQGDTLRTHALAGTRKRGENKKQDLTLEQELWNNPKDRSEHDYVVQDLLGRLGFFIEDIQQGFLHILKLRRLQHINQELSGRLKKYPDLHQLIQHLHPTPAIGGYPRSLALELIQELQCEARGLYSAPFGLIWGKNIECYVAIRSAQVIENEISFYAGSGIVKGSRPLDEWEETERKMNSLEQIF